MPESYNVNIPAEHLRVIGAALNELPYRIAAPVIENLLRQTEAQQPKPTAAPPHERPDV